jgi:hypothetical protein
LTTRPVVFFPKENQPIYRSPFVWSKNIQKIEFPQIQRIGSFLCIYNTLETQCHIQTECHPPSASASIAASASFLSSGDSGVGQSLRSRAGAKLADNKAIELKVTGLL